MSPTDKPLFILAGEIKTPPLSDDARTEAGYLLRRIQRGERLSMPESRPMPSIDVRAHELRIADGPVDWRIVYATEPAAIVVLEVFNKTTRTTPPAVIDACVRRLRDFRRG